MLLGVVGGGRCARAEEVHSFVDSDGTIHIRQVWDGSGQQPGQAGQAVCRVRRERTRRGGVAWRRRRSGFEYNDQVVVAAAKYGLPVLLLKAVMAVESNFNPAAISEKGATGLMQLMPATARDMGVADVYDPAQNIEGGARYLRVLQDEFGMDLETVLAAYNAGPEAVRRAGGRVPRCAETQAYVRSVLAVYGGYLAGR
jgi:soluble lytic murein transglycosylase-like protein